MFKSYLKMQRCQSYPSKCRICLRFVFLLTKIIRYVTCKISKSRIEMEDVPYTMYKCHLLIYSSTEVKYIKNYVFMCLILNLGTYAQLVIV